MGRRAATFWYPALSITAGLLYFAFVLPRWWELMGDTSHSLGTVARIAAGILIALAALPVVFTLLESRRPEFGTPTLALTLRTWSVVSHVTAGVLIVGTAISEIWLSLDSVGQWLFGIYGAAAAVALLGIGGFYLAFVAELPPPPPKPIKTKKEKKPRRGRRTKDGEDADTVAEPDDADIEATDGTATSDAGPDVEATAAEPESTVEEAVPADEPEDSVAAESAGLRNRRPSGKVSHRRRRARRGVVVDE